MKGLIQRTGLAVLGAALALPAAAQTRAWPPTAQPSQPPTTQPAPAQTPPAPAQTPPAPATPPPATAPATQPSAADAQTRSTLENLHTRLVSAVHQGKLASAKATSPKLKAFASKVTADSTRLASELEGIARERGIALTDQATILKQIQPQLDRLGALQGPQFDDAYAEAAATDREDEVAQFKAARDRTPDQDAKLKGWLDSAENVMEEHSNLGFAARREVRDTAQRQGRTPPK